MKDPRLTQMAQTLVNYCVELQPGENLLIEVSGTDFSLTKELIREAYAAGGKVFVTSKNPEVDAVLLAGATEDQIRMLAEYELQRMKQMQAYIAVRGNDNVCEGSDLPPEKGQMHRQLLYSPVHLQQRVQHTKWVVLRVPNRSMAQNAGMATDAFENYYYDICSLDYAKLAKAAQPLAERLNRGNTVHITGKDTDLTFTVKGMPASVSLAKRNMPDGEVMTAPHKFSVNGHITYNLPARANDNTPEPIYFRFQDGKIVDVKCRKQAELNKTLDTDEGGRYIGEYAIGINPKVTKPIMDTLFDEKMTGSMHVTPGNCYKECDNGNYSAIHLDMIYIQTPPFGGGDIWIDDELIRRDGLFVPADLKPLNPENW